MPYTWIVEAGFESSAAYSPGWLGVGDVFEGVVSWKLYYPFRILAVDAVTDAAPGDVCLTLDSEMGEKSLISGMNLSEKTLTVSVDE